jgi:predicted DNA-binding protein (UPF0251 family)/predicted Fe-Mo cluster-binding NifX family protein
MGRDKLKRNITFKPLYKKFMVDSNNKSDKGIINLLNEEMESLYLMDIKKMYQADAASTMGVSRATFARIIKNAREKLTYMLISGSSLHIEDKKEQYNVIVPSESKNTILNSNVNELYYHLISFNNNIITSHQIINNPIIEKLIKPIKIIPDLCIKYNINYFVCNKIGEGLKSVLLSKGIYSIEVDGKIDINMISKLIEYN